MLKKKYEDYLRFCYRNKRKPLTFDEFVNQMYEGQEPLSVSWWEAMNFSSIREWIIKKNLVISQDKMKAVDLYNDYVKYVEVMGRRPVSANRFGREMTQAGFISEYFSLQGKTHRCYRVNYMD